MGLFDRDYDRDFGYRGARGAYGNNAGMRGYDRDLGDRAEGGWNSMKRNTREFFGMDNRYDRGFQGGSNRGLQGGYDRTTFSSGSYGRLQNEPRNTGGYGSQMDGYGQDYRGRGVSGGYDRPYWGYDTARYDRNYKSRQQTDAGDPFGDRQSGTPMRVIDEHHDRDGGWFGSNRGYDRDLGYDRNFSNRGGYGRDFQSANPMGYDPYDGRGGDSRIGRNYDSGFRNNRGYDRDWF